MPVFPHNSVYLVIVEDRHFDTIYKAFGGLDKAMDYAREQAKYHAKGRKIIEGGLNPYLLLNLIYSLDAGSVTIQTIPYYET